MADNFIEGQVTDSSGNPLENFIVAAVRQEDIANVSQSQALEGDVLFKATDVNGNYRFEEAELYNNTNDYHVVAYKNGTELQRGEQNYPFVDATGPNVSDNAVSLYEYEDDSDSLTATDSIGNNNATISGASYTTTSKVGSLALLHDGDSDYSQSNNSVDISALGTDDGCGIAGWINLQSQGSLAYNYIISWVNNDNNFIAVTEDGNGTIQSYCQEAGNVVEIIGPSINTNEWYHVTVNMLSDGSYEFIVHDSSGTEIFNQNTTSSNDPTLIGSGTFNTGYSPAFGNYSNVIVDDFVPTDSPIDTNNLDILINRS